MKPQLISFKLCPFVQKAVLVLLHKGIEFDIEYIDLQNPPDWFMQISPLGKVPALKVGDEVLFESSVIVEYLDEIHAPSLHPEGPLRKAQNRSWMEFGNECLGNGYALITAPDENAFQDQLRQLQDKMDRLEAQLGQGPYFNGEAISLIDYSLLPFFQRQKLIETAVPAAIDESRHPRVKRWADHLLQLPLLAESTVPDFEALYHDMLRNNGSFLSARFQ